ncbi:hypothetical protein DEU56DRAFT_758654 [Suillus clintonianus]|uniref:uncharacterized protein n=1 Tax=Suillus clintonianus TaxID=1904413 RepID=UPI001B8746D1|nr:uncharacterized protein DEU56DRAFT_758654 [Suillus clintonianus]KAG2127206.1 hypothetical protein DEU56DRAFT_758654 [Suillus clintonianus]
MIRLSPLSRSRSANENVRRSNGNVKILSCTNTFKRSRCCGHWQFKAQTRLLSMTLPARPQSSHPFAHHHLRQQHLLQQQTPHLPPPATIELEDEAATDTALMRLWAEILMSPPTGTGALPGTCPLSENAHITQVLSETTPIEVFGLGLVTSGIDTVDWAEQVCVEMGIEKLLEMLPSTQDVVIDSSTTLDVDMDFSDALVWDEVSVY